MLNFAILTAGNIAGQMAATLAGMTHEVTPYAIAARDQNRAAAMAETYGFAKAYGSYEALFADDNVDIVYVASPHNFHAQHVREALCAGKHALCEKPMTVNAAESAELFALAAEKKLVLTEATWTRYQPFVPLLLQKIADGVIGEVQLVTANFGFPLTHKPRLAQPQLAGGALLDLGIYPLTFASIVLGDAVASVNSSCVKTSLGVDGTETITLIYKNNAVASLTACMTAELDNKGMIYGTKGCIEVPLFWHAQQFTVHVPGKEAETVHCPFDISGYEYEVRSLIAAIENGSLECPALPHRETLRMMQLMDTLRADWGVRYPFE